MNNAAWDASGAQPPATLPDASANDNKKAPDSAATDQVFVPSTTIARQMATHAAWAAHQREENFQTVSRSFHPTLLLVDSGLPQSNGADGNDVAQALWDEVVWDQAVWADGQTQLVRPSETHTFTADLVGASETSESVAANVTLGFEANAEVIPTPARAYARLQVPLRAVDPIIRKHAPKRLGHNNPPSPIEEKPRYTMEEFLEMANALDILRRQDPSPRSVPSEAKEAQSTLRRMLEKGADAFAVTFGTAVALTLLAYLKDIVEWADIWFRAIEFAAKMAGV